MDIKEYKTVKNAGTCEYIEKRSRFISHCFPVKTEEEALFHLNRLKQEYWDASHNVYAYIIKDNNIMRYSDDGEPGGTAGVPVLDILKKESLTDVLVVVTRYFGGILLGTGGLVHAYSKSAKLGLDASEIVDMVLCTKIIISCSYTLLGKIQFETEGFCEAFIDNIEYGEDVKLSVFVKTDFADKFIDFINDKSNGNAEFQKLETTFFEKK